MKYFRSATIWVAGVMAALGGLAPEILTLVDAMNIPEVKDALTLVLGPRASIVWAVLVVLARLRTLR